MRKTTLTKLLILTLACGALGLRGADTAIAPAAAGEKKEFETVEFSLLGAFNYVPPGYETNTPDGKAAPADAKPKDQIPDFVRKLDAKKVAITGFMLPTKFKDGKVTEFLLMKDQSSCCFGVMPRINEWVTVKMTNGGIPPLMDTPITLVGKLKVGELFEEGYLAAIYQLDGERLLETKS
jgi:hypothetical protein